MAKHNDSKKKKGAAENLAEKKNAYYKKWTQEHGSLGKDEFEAVWTVLEYIQNSKSNLEHSCYHYAFQEDANFGVSTGGSWYDRWDLHDKMSIMWYRTTDSDDFISNIKSPMARGRINTFVNWVKKLNLEFTAKPNNKEDVNPAFVAEKITNYWMHNSNAKTALNDAWEEACKYGSAFLKLSYVKETKSYRFKKTKQLNDEDRKKIKEGEKVIYTEPQEKVIIDDAVLEHVPIREAYPDAQSRNHHGDSYRAERFARKRVVSLDYARSLYANHPEVKNLDKVKGGADYRDDEDYFFEPPRDYGRQDLVELMEFEDQENDRYVVLANDICILDTPLPHDHKEISYHKIDFIKVPGQYFSIGICDLLENIQGSYEIALNMVADYVYKTYNYRLMVSAANGDELIESLARTDNMIIPVDDSDGVPIGNKVFPLSVSPIGFDIFQFLQLLETNATLATNIDPAQMALLAGSKTATSDILNKELLMTLIGSVIDTNVTAGLRQIGRQLWALQRQFYPIKKVKTIVGDEGKEETKLVNRTFRFDGIEIELNEDAGVLEEKEIGDDAYSFFELKDDYLNTRDEVDIQVRPESAEVQSQAMEEQKTKEEFAQLIPFAIDPNNPDQAMMHPMPMIDATKLFKEYFKINKLPEDLLINKAQDNKQALESAEAHVMAIFEGKQVSPKPGQSSEHLEYEYAVLESLIYKANEISEQLNQQMEEDFDNELQRIMNTAVQDPTTGVFIDVDTGQPVQPIQPEPDPEKLEQLESIEEKIEALEQHIMVEAMPGSMRNSRIAMMQGAGGGEAPNEGQAPPVPMPEASGAPQVDAGAINNPNPAMQVPMGGGAAPTTLPNAAQMV